MSCLRACSGEQPFTVDDRCGHRFRDRARAGTPRQTRSRCRADTYTHACRHCSRDRSSCRRSRRRPRSGSSRNPSSQLGPKIHLQSQSLLARHSTQTLRARSQTGVISLAVAAGVRRACDERGVNRWPRVGRHAGVNRAIVVIVVSAARTGARTDCGARKQCGQHPPASRGRRQAHPRFSEVV